MLKILETYERDYGKIRKNEDCYLCLNGNDKEGKGSGRIGKYVKFYSGVPKDTRAKMGVVHKNLMKNIKHCQEVNEKIIPLELNKNGHKLIIITIYVISDTISRKNEEKKYGKIIGMYSA